MTAGLLIAGGLHPTPGVTVIPPMSHGGPPWGYLDSGDYAMRPSTYVSQIILHTTGGHWPQPVITGSGPAGHARQIAEMWSGADRGDGKRVHSGAQLIVDYNGDVYCLADLVRVAAYHAEGSNPRSVGIEMCTTPQGGIYGATLDATALLVALLTWSGVAGSGLLPIPAQMPRGPYRNVPLRRMETGAGASRANSGGRDCVGVFGHRDNTSRRGAGDPGNEIFQRLAALGFEGLDFDGREDIEVGRARQTLLTERGAQIVADGIVGPASIAAARSQGYARWRDVPAAA